MAGPDRARFRRSLDLLNEIMTEIVKKAEDVSLRRCPYKNASDRCTAHFGCRYQRPPREGRRSGSGADRSGGSRMEGTMEVGTSGAVESGGLKVCTSDDKLDYRKAWEVE